MRCRFAQGELWRIDYLGRNYHPAENRIIEAIAMASDVTTLKLWKVLVLEGDDAQRKLVESLANHAGAILDRVIADVPNVYAAQLDPRVERGRIDGGAARPKAG